MLKIVRGEPSDEELAALIAVLAVLPGATKPLAPRSAWADPAHRLRTPLDSGLGARQRQHIPE